MVSKADEITQLREATREAHEAAQAIKEQRTLLKQEADAVLDRIDDWVTERVTTELSRLTEAVGKAIDSATVGVYKRFDTIAEILLGEDARSKRSGYPSLTKYAERVRDLLDEERARAAAEPSAVDVMREEVASRESAVSESSG